MLSIIQNIFFVCGIVFLWIGIGYVVAAIRYKAWPILLWSAFWIISALRIMAQAVHLWTDYYATWYILNAIALMAFLTFTLKYHGWRLIREHKIHRKRIFLFWQK